MRQQEIIHQCALLVQGERELECRNKAGCTGTKPVVVLNFEYHTLLLFQAKNPQLDKTNN